MKDILLALALCGLLVSLCAAGSGLVLINELGKTPAQTQFFHGEAPASSRGYEGRAWVTWHCKSLLSPVDPVFLIVDPDRRDIFPCRRNHISDSAGLLIRLVGGV